MKRSPEGCAPDPGIASPGLRRGRNDSGVRPPSPPTLPSTQFSGVAGMSICVTPSTDSASMIALIIAGGLPTEPASPAPFTPSGLDGAGHFQQIDLDVRKIVGARQCVVHEAAGQQLAGAAS